MSEPKLFTATFRGRKDVLVAKCGGCPDHYDIVDSTLAYSSRPVPGKDFTDLHEVKVVDMDAVVIEGVSKAELVAELKDAQSCLTDLGCCVDDRHGLIPFLAQLSTPAEPAIGGEDNLNDHNPLIGAVQHALDTGRLPRTGMKSPTHETTEISSTSLKKCNCNVATVPIGGHLLWCDSVTSPQSPKGVWIELTELKKLRNLVFTVNFQNMRELGRKKDALKLLDSWIFQLTPRMDEPKVLIPRVEASCTVNNNRAIWRGEISDVTGTTVWVREKDGYRVDWSDLINPTKEG